VLSFISMQGYAGNRIEEFTRLLGRHAYDGPMDWIECRPYVQRYTELKQQSRGAKLHDQLLAFAEDAAMATAMATDGPGAMVIAQVAIDMTVVEFFWRSLFLAAYAFGDKKTASELLERCR